MDASTIQQRVWKGYGKSASVLGTPYNFYRPSGSDWMTSGTLKNLQFSRNVSLNAEDMKYSKPNKYGKATWYALFDANSVQVGDYFVGDEGTFFVAAIQLHLPILVVGCNRTVSISRVPAQSSVGAVPYSSLVGKQAFVANVPCSILQGTKGEKNDTSLPGDTRTPWWTVLLPAAVGQVRYGDTITDDLGNDYTVSSSELTDLGYRLTAMLAIT